MNRKKLLEAFSTGYLREEFQNDIHYRIGDRWDTETNEYVDSKGRTSYETMYAYECYITGYNKGLK
jgi:hypothetical protein